MPRRPNAKGNGVHLSFTAYSPKVDLQDYSMRKVPGLAKQVALNFSRYRVMFVGLISLLGLIGCAETVGPSGPAVFGWRSAGLVMKDADHYGGLHQMIKVGSSLFAMDAFSSDSAPTKRWSEWRIWEMRDGKWTQLVMPQGEIPNSWVTQNGRLLVGTKYSGRILRFNPDDRTWDSISMPIRPESSDTVWTISTLGLYLGRIFVGSITSGSLEHVCWLGGDDSAGLRIPCFGKNQNIVPDDVLEFDGALYAIDQQWGIYRWKTGDAAWEQLPSARGRTNSSEEEGVSAIGIHHGKLYVGYAGYYDGLYRWNGDGTWTWMTPKPPDGTNRAETPRDIRVITSYKDRLYMAGVAGSSVCYWAPKDSTKPAWGDWRLADDGWCEATEYRCGSQNWGIVGIGDTLYATGWGFVAKSPIADIEKMGRPFYTTP